jgi:hypothetical protein
MPSNIPSYVYSLFAALIVGTILVTTCSVAMANVKNKAETQQLQNLDEYVAAQSLSLIADSTRENQNSTQTLDVPSQIGNQRFWISISNDTQGAWVQAGFGTTAYLSQPKFYIPAQIAASGLYISGSGRLVLECSSINQVVTLKLVSEV